MWQCNVTEEVRELFLDAQQAQLDTADCELLQRVLRRAETKLEALRDFRQRHPKYWVPYVAAWRKANPEAYKAQKQREYARRKQKRRAQRIFCP